MDRILKENPDVSTSSTHSPIVQSGRDLPGSAGSRQAPMTTPHTTTHDTSPPTVGMAAFLKPFAPERPVRETTTIQPAQDMPMMVHTTQWIPTTMADNMQVTTNTQTPLQPLTPDQPPQQPGEMEQDDTTKSQIQMLENILVQIQTDQARSSEADQLRLRQHFPEVIGSVNTGTETTTITSVSTATQQTMTTTATSASDTTPQAPEARRPRLLLTADQFLSQCDHLRNQWMPLWLKFFVKCCVIVI